MLTNWGTHWTTDQFIAWAADQLNEDVEIMTKAALVSDILLSPDEFNTFSFIEDVIPISCFEIIPIDFRGGILSLEVPKPLTKENIYVALRSFSERYGILDKTELFLILFQTCCKYGLQPIDPNENQEYFVYLFQNQSNRQYKIGVSKDYAKRYSVIEKQGGVSNLKVVLTKKFDSKREAYLFESNLHKIFAENRIVGEWFELSPSEVASIKFHLSIMN